MPPGSLGWGRVYPRRRPLTRRGPGATGPGRAGAACELSITGREFRAADGALHAVLGKGTSPTIVVKPGAGRTAELIWTSADAKRNLSASLARAGSIE